MAVRIGQQLGNYRLTRLLGQGGFADVYLGEHIHLNTQAAIKVLRTQLSSEDVINFRIEARTIAHLAHPNIVQVLDFGVEESTGTPFLVMAFAPNGTLRQRHPRGQPLAATTIISYVKQVGAALQYAHSQKLIHRDIKPENMLVGRNNEILLSDFGIALPTASAREQSILAHNAPPDESSWNPVGTVTYMAPEQIQGRPSPASDQYALGVVVYEWICGVPPFVGGYVEIAMQKISATPGSLRARRPDVPADVEMVVLHALAIDPQRRFKSVQAFATALEQAYNPAISTVISVQSNTPRILPVVATLTGPDGPIKITGEVVSLGRHPGNRIVLANDVKASARHAELRLAGRSYCVVDLSSTNGTFLNGEKLVPETLRALKHGDTLVVGDTSFAFTTGEGEQSRPSSDGSTVRAEEPPAVSAPATPGIPFEPLPPTPATPGYAAYRSSGNPSAPLPQTPSGGFQNPVAPAYSFNPAQPMQPGASLGGPGFNPGYMPGPGSFSGAMPVVPAQQEQVVNPGYMPGPGSFSGAMPVVLNAQGPVGNNYNYAMPTPMPSVPSEFLAPRPVQPPGFVPPIDRSYPPIPRQPMPVRPRNRFRLIAAIILLVVLIASVSTGLILYRNSLPTPGKVLNAFCTDLQNKDTTSAWNLLTPQLQTKLGQQALFTSFFANTTTCSAATPLQSNNSATSSLTLVSPVRSTSDNVTLVLESNGTWEVDNESSLTGLVQLLQHFCSTMVQDDHTSAYSDLSTVLQTSITSTQFPLYFPTATSCTYAGLSMTKDGAQITISQGTTSGAVDNNLTKLVVDGTGAWKINDFANLPTKTLTAFCTDLQNGDYQDAYNQTSTAFQGGYPESTFASDFAIFSSCTPNPLAQVQGNLSSDLTFTLKNGGTVPFTSFLVRDSSNARWKIDSLTNFPDQTVNTFCDDLNSKSYQDAYNQLSPGLQANVSETVFAQNYAGVTNCVPVFPSQSGNQATSIITYTLTNNSTAKQAATLEEIGTDNWKISDLKNV